MTESEKIAVLKTMTNETDEAMLQVYLLLAGDAILHKLYPFDDNKSVIPERYHLLQCQCACYLYEKRGAEGELSHIENGVSRSYESGDIPQSMLRHVVPYLGVI